MIILEIEWQSNVLAQSSNSMDSKDTVNDIPWFQGCRSFESKMESTLFAVYLSEIPTKANFKSIYRLYFGVPSKMICMLIVFICTVFNLTLGSILYHLHRFLYWKAKKFQTIYHRNTFGKSMALFYKVDFSWLNCQSHIHVHTHAAWRRKPMFNFNSNCLWSVTLTLCADSMNNWADI